MSTQSTPTAGGPRVRVNAPARLHLGFLDMNGGLGRKFGGVGLSIGGPRTRLELRPAAETSVEGPESARARKLLGRAVAALAPGRHYALTLSQAIPAHAGLGSGTQLALAIAAALRRLEGLAPDTAGDAALLQRGARSGLGAGLFDQGGLVVDGGRGAGTLTPPVVARLAFPQEWRVLLISDAAAAGLHGADEFAAFAALPAPPDAEPGELCRRVLMQALPALVERDLAGFGAAIARVQEIVGDYFAPTQGGRRFTSPRVEALVARLQRDGAVGGGQTSWGPTGFVFAASEDEAKALVARVGDHMEGAEIAIVEGVNRGATIDAVYAQMA